MPTMVTSGGRAVSINTRAGGFSRIPSRNCAPIGFCESCQSLAAVSLITATRSPRRTSPASNMRPASSRNPERAKIIGAAKCRDDALRLISRLTNDSEGCEIAAEGMAERCGLHSRYRADPIEQIRRETVAGVQRRILRRRQRNADHQDPFCGRTDVDALQREERSDSQTGTDEQHDRKRDFDHDEQIARPSAFGRRARASAGAEGHRSRRASTPAAPAPGRRQCRSGARPQARRRGPER